METLRWQQHQLILLDQTKLPLEESYSLGSAVHTFFHTAWLLVFVYGADT